MRQQEIFRKIGGIINELNEQYDYLKSLNEYSDLELELFQASAQFLKDHTEILKKLNHKPVQEIKQPEILVSKGNPPFEAPAAIIAQPVEEAKEDGPIASLQQSVAFVKDQKIESGIPPVSEMITNVESPVVSAPEEEKPTPEVSIAQTQPDNFSYIRQEPEVSSEQHTFSLSRETEDALQQPVNLTASETEPDPHTQPVTMEPAKPTQTGEQPVLTLNQKLSAQLKPENKENQTAPAGLPVTDIKSAINLNDKLLFVKDLFNGYNLSYSEAIDLLNRCKNFDEADRFLKANYAVKNRWAEKQTTADKFYTLLRRRFV